jgi:asparagine synthase (glutamine-hydrolysing)
MAPVEPTLMRELFETPLRFEEVYEEAIQLWDENPKKDLIDRSLEFFTNLYLQSDILTKVDRAGMLVSLESRAVFLDNDLVDFARRLPNRFKFRNGQQKYLLKKAMARFLPDDVLSRPKKGFGLPTAKWLRTMMPSRDVDIDGVRTSTLYRWWREHRDGQGDHRLALWTHLALLEFLAGRSSGDAKRHVA